MNIQKSIFFIPFCVLACQTQYPSQTKQEGNDLTSDTAVDTAEDIENSTDPQDTTEPEDTNGSTTDPEDTSNPQDPEASITIEGLRQSGSYTYSDQSASASLSACDSPLAYTRVQTSKANATSIILAHGFFRNSGNMIDWAHHWASWGFDVYVIDMCHFSDHAKNGEAMAELADYLNISAPIFAGQSAGGLASFVAGSYNNNALGVLGLDATDDGMTTGASIASQVSVPVLGLVGESSFCNSDNNGITMLRGSSNSTILRVRDADHCDFEFPTDGLCTFACENQMASISDAEIHNTILSLSTAGLLWLSENDADAADLWTGDQKQELINSGAVEAID